MRELLHGGFGEGGGYQETEWQVACSASYFSTDRGAWEWFLLGGLASGMRSGDQTSFTPPTRRQGAAAAVPGAGRSVSSR